MKSFENGYLERLPLSHGLLRTMRQLGEFRGREELYRRQHPQVLETLRQVAVIQSTESSNRIEDITAPLDRFRALMADQTMPRDRPEQQIIGYRHVLNTIHGNWPGIRFTEGLVLQLHRDLFQFTDRPGGLWKSTDNEIVERHPDGRQVLRFAPVRAHQTPAAMRQLHEQFSAAWQAEEVDRLLLVAAYVLDFLCIHPFLDGNGRMARLLTLLLLYHAGFEVGRFVSLERLIESSRDSYYAALGASSLRWHEGEHDLRPWSEYFLGILLAAYREFESRIDTMTAGRGAKSALVREAIERTYGDFTVADLQQQCPNVSIDLVRKILREERDAGRVECLDRGGAGARWRHT